MLLGRELEVVLLGRGEVPRVHTSGGGRGRGRGRGRGTAPAASAPPCNRTRTREVLPAETLDKWPVWG